MTPRSMFVLVLVAFYIFAGNASSIVKLNNGGYDDIVIAINPNVKEDLQIIENIKDMVKEATGFLFDATGKRLYIRSVKILIPVSWSAKNYSRPKTETYDKADIIIADPIVKFGNDPYTQQYGGCGEPGQYIHLTPEYITDDDLISSYGPRGKVFVHEWAHLRWGVFDEYNQDTPFYIADTQKVEATRCSGDILGEYRIQKCQGTSCKVTSCNFDPNTGLYEKGCVYVPQQSQIATESLMYMQFLPDVTKFCDDSNHNPEAPNMQNRKCNSRSTWDVIMSSTDIKSTPPNPGLLIPDPTFTLLQFSERVVTLVLDTSGSMASFNRIQRLYQAAEVFIIQIIETGSDAGMVTFSNSAVIKSNLIKVKSDTERQQLKALLPRVGSGGTNICSGLLSGIQVNKGKSGSSHGTEVVLLSDGEDNYDTRLCFQQIIDSGVIVHVIFLGSAEEPTLKEIVQKTGGTIYLATDNTEVSAQGLIDAFSSISAGDGDITKQSIQLESTALGLKPSECLSGTVYVDRTVGNDTFFLVTWQTAVPNIKLQSPSGIIYTAAQFVSDNTAKSSRLAIPGKAESGPWDYSLCNSRSSVEILGLVVNSKASDETVPPIIVNAHMNQDINQYPHPMVIYASLSQGLMPVIGANVTATIETVSGQIVTIELLDNGAGPDIMKNDGVYSRYFTQFSANGRYGLKVRAENNSKNKSRLALPNNRALYIPGLIINGTVIMNPPRPEIPDDDLNVGEFSRTASGGSFLVSDVPSGPQPDIYKPEKITDLEATIVDDKIVLSWTATGDDLDQGTATSYDLRMSLNPSDLRTNFNRSTPINISALTPLTAGSRETFSFLPENIVIQNGTILYFALVAIDKVDHRSDVSNIAQAALVIPPTPAPTTTPALTTTRTATTRTATTRTATTRIATTRIAITPAPTTATTTESATTDTRPKSTAIVTPPRTDRPYITAKVTRPSTDPPAGDSSAGLNASVITGIVCGAVVLICIIVSVTVCIVSCNRNNSNITV
ncbi:calcium-activated chloride channel regulator 1-like [Dendropsophus ebraccatus]|uniref:calcium-activated chloride channel regulator 1-like n=1 Tax=Dendropsophus ebraccatus TaxID=150705 RepID=UPI0038313364